MKNSTIVSLLVLAFVLFSVKVKAQGCSDAGFCTINSFKPVSADEVQLRNHFKVGFSGGAADHSINAYGTYLEYGYLLNNNLWFDAKLTSLAQNGNEISTFGFSDIYLNANFGLSEKTKLTLGAKIPLNDANKKGNGMSLPMDYQSSLGTFDLVFGLAYSLNKLQLVAAIQQPLTQNNNQFIAQEYPIDSKLRDFQSTNNFKRSGDVLLRVSFPLAFSKKLTFTPSLLPIYHLGNDKYTNIDGIEMEIDGSAGLTLNGNAYFDFEINKTNALQLNLGMPFIVRDARPDGLTRSFIANLEYQVRF